MLSPRCHQRCRSQNPGKAEVVNGALVFLRDSMQRQRRAGRTVVVAAAVVVAEVDVAGPRGLQTRRLRHQPVRATAMT